MNYVKLYFAFIEKYKNQVFEKDVYTEKHHIIPRHAGGDDSKENIIRLNYKQHTFAHHILWKAYHRTQDYSAWLLMSKQEADVKLATCKALGKANVLSGLLDKIRPLANTPQQRQHARALIQSRINSGEHYENIKKANEAWRGCHHTEEYKLEKSKSMKIWSDENKDHYFKMNLESSKLKTERSKLLSETVLQNAKRNEEFLHKTSSKSLNIFISPEGLEFDSPIFAAKYYGDIKPYIIENWCKRNQHGWSRKPKAT